MKSFTLKQEINRIEQAILSTHERFEEFNPKINKKQYLQTLLKLTLELGILIGKEQKFYKGGE